MFGSCYRPGRHLLIPIAVHGVGNSSAVRTMATYISTPASTSTFSRNPSDLRGTSFAALSEILSVAWQQRKPNAPVSIGIRDLPLTNQRARVNLDQPNLPRSFARVVELPSRSDRDGSVGEPSHDV